MVNLKYDIKGLYVGGLRNANGEMFKYKLGGVEVDVTIGDLTDTSTVILSDKFKKETLDKLSDVILLMQKELDEYI